MKTQLVILFAALMAAGCAEEPSEIPKDGSGCNVSQKAAYWVEEPASWVEQRNIDPSQFDSVHYFAQERVNCLDELLNSDNGDGSTGSLRRAMIRHELESARIALEIAKIRNPTWAAETPLVPTETNRR